MRSLWSVGIPLANERIQGARADLPASTRREGTSLTSNTSYPIMRFFRLLPRVSLISQSSFRLLDFSSTSASGPKEWRDQKAELFSLQPIIDPTHLESVLSTGSLSVTLNAQRELCVLSKAGGTPLGADEIMRVVRVAVDRVRDLIRILEEALERDRAIRVVEVR